MLELLEETTDWLKTRGITAPEVGIILGTGMDGLAKHIEVEKEYSYNVIPHFPI
ncbi:MAG: purine-nucleoside phosphorylase, partial [Flavobacteriales bacterium]|nr:purine-nucleoside phosphorylase [Flavobacteriales bacterium]